MASGRKGNRGKTTSTEKQIENTPASPNWPGFYPKPPVEDLSLHMLHPGQIVTIPGFWTSALCKNYVKFLSTLPLVTTPGKPKRGEAVRVNDRYQINDPVFAQQLWSETGLRDLVFQGSFGEDQDVDGSPQAQQQHAQELWGGTPIGLNPNIRVYRYSKGQFFDQHYDDFNTLTHPGPPLQPSRTTWTLLLYLTSASNGCFGGETVFYPEAQATSKKNKRDQPASEPIVVRLETGMALLHKHGQDCMLHEGREVTQGEKWVIRSDLCVAR